MGVRSNAHPTAESDMKLLKAVVLVLLLAATGCKESADSVTAAHAKRVAATTEYYSLYSGASIPN
jgi:hypothetical protein